MLFLNHTVFDLLSAVKTVFILSLSAHSNSHMLTHKNTLVWACLVKKKNPTAWWGFLILPPFLTFFFLFPPLWQIAMSSSSVFFPPPMLMFTYVCNSRPFNSTPLFWDREGSVPRGTDRLAVVNCSSLPGTADTHTAGDSLQNDTGLLVYGGGSVWGRKGMRQAG